MTPTRGNHRGFSLTELLVAMVIGIILLGGLVTLMVNSKKNYAVQDYSARLQENARFAMQFLSYDLRMAGFYGCSNTISGIGHEANQVVRLAGENDTGSHGDSVTVAYAHPTEQIQLLSYAADSADEWTVERIPADWGEANDEITLVVADCGGASVLNATITNEQNADGNSELTISWQGGDKTFAAMKNELGRIFDPADQSSGPTMLRALVANEYCIETGVSGIPTLHRANLPDDCDDDAPELVEGVENLQLLYHDIATGSFQPAVPANPESVRATQLALLVRSVSNESLEDGANREYGSGAELTLDSGPHTLLGQTVNPGEIRGQRKVFNNTLVVRNRRQ